MRIATWNVNSITARMPRFVPWLEDRQPDVVAESFPFFYQTSASDEKFVTSVSGLTPAVPEPATITLLGLGLAGLGARRCRRRKA